LENRQCDDFIPILSPLTSIIELFEKLESEAGCRFRQSEFGAARNNEIQIVPISTESTAVVFSSSETRAALMTVSALPHLLDRGGDIRLLSLKPGRTGHVSTEIFIIAVSKSLEPICTYLARFQGKFFQTVDHSNMLLFINVAILASREVLPFSVIPADYHAFARESSWILLRLHLESLSLNLSFAIISYLAIINQIYFHYQEYSRISVFRHES
jgi:hypothetical protein